jgi:PPM family protein phosphatase
VLVSASSTVQVLTSGQRKNPPVGSGGAPFTPFVSVLAAPWAVLVMTDGVWKYAGWDSLLQVRPDEAPQRVLDRLRDRAALPVTGDLQDDFTLLILHDGERSPPGQ